MLNSSHSDQELILLWKQGNEHAFVLLYKRHVKGLLAVALQKLQEKSIAEDLVQDTFISFYNKKDTLVEDTTIFAYLYVSLKNRILITIEKVLLFRDILII